MAGFFTVELLNGGFHLGLAVTQLPEAERLHQGTLAYLHEGRQPLPDECLIDFFLGGALLLHLLDEDVRLRYFPGGERVVFEAGFDVYELVVEFSFVFAMVLSSPSLVDVFCGVAGVGAFSLITGCFERYLNRMFMLTAARVVAQGFYR